jgi:hypothetical protein
VERIPELPGAPYRLGRNVRHDPRSLRYAIAGLPTSTLESRRWKRRIPVLNQGDLGSCTGNAATGWVGTDSSARQGLTEYENMPVDEDLAIALYSAATRFDDFPGDYPPSDTGSDGLSVSKALQSDGLCSAYQHAFSLQAALTALQTGPVLFGTEWRAEMFHPATDGRLTIQGEVAGGHEYLVDEIDVERKRIWLTNSWKDSWGVDGRAYLTWEDADTLLGRRGDVTVPTPVAAPTTATITQEIPTGAQIAGAVRAALAELHV